MNNFTQSVNIMMSRDYEGGYVNDPNDPGGETKYGISKRAYPNLDIKNLTMQQAAKLYQQDYWDECSCDYLPAGIDFAVFDYAVNQGVSAAKLMLQEAAGVKADGAIGNITLTAINRADKEDLLIKFMALRALDYSDNRGLNRYGEGWFRRMTRTTIIATKMAGI